MAPAAAQNQEADKKNNRAKPQQINHKRTEMIDLEQILANDQIKYPDANPCSLQDIFAAIGPQPIGCKLSKRSNIKGHSPQNSRWMPLTQQTKAEFLATVQALALGKP